MTKVERAAWRAASAPMLVTDLPGPEAETWIAATSG